MATTSCWSHGGPTGCARSPESRWWPISPTPATSRGSPRARREPDVSILINNAGINGYGPAEAVDPKTMAHVIAVNVTAPALLTRAALPGMLERGDGTIVNVASMLAFAASLPPDPMPHRVTYAATKGFIATFTRTLAAELDGRPVHVQLLCPGYTKTEFHLTHGTEPKAGTAPTDQPFGMSAQDVVTASLAALETGEVVVVPGLEDGAAIDRLIAAEMDVRASDRGGALAARYTP